MFEKIGITMLMLFIIGISILMPFVLIWSLNILFKLNIAYTLKTWFASFLLISMFGNYVVSINKK